MINILNDEMLKKLELRRDLLRKLGKSEADIDKTEKLILTGIEAIAHANTEYEKKKN